MKLFRIRTDDGTCKPACLDSQGRSRDLSIWVDEHWRALPSIVLNDEKLERCPLLPDFDVLADAKMLAPCVGQVGKLICFGFNSKRHVEEMGLSLPDEPVFFMKATSAISGAYDPIIYPRCGEKLDWEAELAVVIGKIGKYVTPEAARDMVLGFCCFNDVSDRGWQFEHAGNQHTKGKSFDSFAPMGPFLVTPDECLDPCHLLVSLKVNGEVRQSFSTHDYIYNVYEAISAMSQFFTLYPGDVIALGSGPGNAHAWGDGYLHIGDQVELSIGGLGTQRQSVIAEHNP